jgi:SAM-dependent methyltransferase
MRDMLREELRRIEDVHWWLAGRRDILLHFLGSEVETGRMPRAALDCGCGSGTLLGRIEAGAVAVGLDLHRPEGRTDSPVRFVQGSVEALPFTAGAFDVICAFDVLEHVENDVRTLEQMARCLKPGGRLFVSVPAYAMLWDALDDLAGHVRRYRLRELRAKLKRAGLEAVRLTYFNTFLFPAVLAVRMLRKLERRLGVTSPPSDFAVPRPRALNAMLRAVFASELRLLRRIDFPYGGSILAIAGHGARSGQ